MSAPAGRDRRNVLWSWVRDQVLTVALFDDIGVMGGDDVGVHRRGDVVVVIGDGGYSLFS